ITDAWITATVKWFYAGEDSLKNSDIDVGTNNGIVTLKGTVPTAAGKVRAVELVRETDGRACTSRGDGGGDWRTTHSLVAVGNLEDFFLRDARSFIVYLC